MQKKRLFSNPNRKKLIIDNRVYTKNFTGPIDLVEEHPLIIHKRTRDSESYESDLYKLKRISDTGLTRILGGRGTIEKMFQDVFQKNILPHIDPV